MIAVVARWLGMALAYALAGCALFIVAWLASLFAGEALDGPVFSLILFGPPIALAVRWWRRR